MFRLIDTARGRLRGSGKEFPASLSKELGVLKVSGSQTFSPVWLEQSNVGQSDTGKLLREV